MTQANALLGLLAQTSIHAGTGQNTGAIDLPIQREGHNGYPCIYGSSMKGALRSHAETVHGKGADEVILGFGPDSQGEIDHAGALMISDARLLLLPVRSLTSQFKWVTCPAVLNRYQQDARRFGVASAGFEIPNIPLPTEGAEATAVISEQTHEDNLFLEEYRFKTQRVDIEPIIQALSPLMNSSGNTKENLHQQLTIINNDMFSHICQQATPVNAHIAIDSSTKVVRRGHLWYEETLPPETLLYVGISASMSRKKGVDTAPEAILANLTDLFTKSPWLQIGGNETVGMGWCAVNTLTAQPGA